MLPSEKPSQILFDTVGGELVYNPPVPQEKTVNVKPQHLYILSNEEIKEGDWCINSEITEDHQDYMKVYQYEREQYAGTRKIIATTDPKLHTNEIVEEDMHMYKKSLPQIPQSFIEEYCKAGGIDEVLVSVDSYLNIPVGTSVKFNDRLPSTLKEYEGLDGRVIWGVEDRLDVGNNCIKVEFLNKYNNVCNLNASVCHWYKSIKHLYYNKVAIDSNNCIIIHPVEEKMYTEEQRKDIIELVKSAFYNGIAHERGSKMDIDKWIEENL